MSDTPRTDNAFCETLRTDNAEYINIRFARELERDLMRAMKERDSWKAKAEANERDARLYRWIVHEPEAAKQLLNLLQHGKGTVDDFGRMIERIAASKDAARSAEKEKE